MMDKVLFPELSYTINGILFETHNSLGQFANEKQYGDLIENRLRNHNIPYEREKVLPPSFAEEKPGRHRVDFLVADVIIIELKSKLSLDHSDFRQTTRYLQALNKKLALLVNFRTKYLKIKRILNSSSNEITLPAITDSTHSNIRTLATFAYSSSLKIKIKKLHPEARLPCYAHPGDAGLDLFSLEDYTLQPGERKIFLLGFALEFPFGYAAIIKDKSSLPKNGGLHTWGGVFDAGYRGEYNVGLINLGQEPYQIEKGNKIAQLVIFPVASAELEEVAELSESARGSGKFGSTGK